MPWQAQQELEGKAFRSESSIPIPPAGDFVATCGLEFPYYACAGSGSFTAQLGGYAALREPIG